MPLVFTPTRVPHAARLCFLATGLLLAARATGQEVDFARQIRPILSKNCFSCHGHDAKHRKAKLRLDTREGAIAAREDSAAVVPGDSGRSLLHARITDQDPEERMPPPDAGRALTKEEVDLLRRWIDQGAEYAPHWAFTKPVRDRLPNVRDKSWVKNPLDAFVLSGLESKGLRPAAKADRHTLIRRLSFDLTGLPPTLAQVEEFVSDKSAKAYEQLVDRLLASPAYGERWARVWLDLARYADTQGYEKDKGRTVWPWRDWVIKALNDDMPYDQFSIDQLAGDLLPDPTPQQVLATVFHRNTMTNTEGGTDDEEFRVVAVKDRVDTTGLIWLGLSVGCAKCHTHKYDPISHTEYYQLFGFFNQTADADRYDDAPKRALSSAYRHPEHPKMVAQLAAERTKLKAAPKNKSITRRIASLRRRMGTVAVPVMRELSEKKRRRTRVLAKGDFLSPGRDVKAGVPKALHAMRAGPSRNRLDLARWLMDKENPLTARVTVNRTWSRIFGAGLVETEEDFGTQGELPSHPDLLDWLAIEFRGTHRWSQKKLCKTIVMSATYRQSSHVTPALLERDPRNRLLARGPRFRLEAEMIRDQALAVSGLLTRRLYGPPVMPPQPKGVWKTVYNSGRWVNSTGEDRYRRGLYTFAKRTAAYPSSMLLDAGSGEICLPRRIRTNTATAALVTLNDPVYTEAAQALARRVVGESHGDVSRRVAHAWRLVTGRPPRDSEVARITRLFERQLEHYGKHADAALEMATVPLGALPKGMKAVEMAAWTVVASVLLNLDETLSKG
jgi:hypothetical protein